MVTVSLADSSFSFLQQGAIIQEFRVSGQNIVLSFPVAEPYFSAPYFGETIGRVANRISDGLIRDLNGRSYSLATNQADQNHLHGGNIGWGHKKFSGPQHVTRNGRAAIRFTYLSPDGEEGYPGTIELRVWYLTYEDTEKKAVLEIEYEAELVGRECEETVVNVTNHTYFNIGNGSTIDGTEVDLATDQFLVTDDSGVPTGEMTTYSDIRANHSFMLGAKEPSIDSCFVMDKVLEKVPLDTRTRKLRRLASAHHASTGLRLEVFSTEPSFQFYTGDYVDVAASEHGPARKPRSGFCIEPCRFVNAINVPEWRDQVVLPRGQIWGSRIVYKAWKDSISHVVADHSKARGF